MIQNKSTSDKDYCNQNNITHGKGIFTINNFVDRILLL